MTRLDTETTTIEKAVYWQGQLANALCAGWDRDLTSEVPFQLARGRDQAVVRHWADLHRPPYILSVLCHKDVLKVLIKSGDGVNSFPRILPPSFHTRF
jgi:hypothetical protein